MTFEVTCGQCDGQLIVETPGIVVACPHCGIHLSIPPTEEFAAVDELARQSALEPDAHEAEQESESDPAFVHESSSNVFDSTSSRLVMAGDPASSVSSVVIAMPVDTEEVDEDLVLPNVSVTSAEDDEHPEVPPSSGETSNEENAAAESAGEVSVPESTGESESAVTTEDASDDPPESPTAILKTSPIVSTPPRRSQAARSRKSSTNSAHENGDPATVPKAWFLYAISYASAVTLVLLYLLLFSANGSRQHQLESLPDLVPPTDDDGRILYQLAPPDAELPPGHTLEIGDERRFGNVRVKVVKVTKGPLEFRHFAASTGLSRPKSSPVLKLWLEFENVSDDQVFAPLDRTLVLTRHPHAGGELVSNNVLRPLSGSGTTLLTYDMPVEGEWEIVGTNYGRRLKPQETLTTFIPSEDAGIDKLSGELVWRIQIRKGYHPQSHRGVTTLIDVRFRADEIQPETAPTQSA